MKINSAIFEIVAIAAVVAARPNPFAVSYLPFEDSKPAYYEPIGNVVGDHSVPSEFPSKVVLNYVASCSNVDIGDPSSCLNSRFAEEQVPTDLSTTLDSFCFDAPIINVSIIEYSAFAAMDYCQSIGNAATLEDTLALIANYETILGTTSCWTDVLCGDHAHLYIESKWLGTCAGVLDLPYPISEGTTESAAKDKSLLTCMLDKAFDTSPTALGFASDPVEGSLDACYPPGYETATSCQAIVGPKVYNTCSNSSYFEEEQFMSMNYMNTLNDKQAYVDAFCEILDAFSSSQGRDCLEALCDADEAAPSTATVVPSASPTVTTLSPSKSPSKNPSASPSVTASKVPSASPSFKPSTSPSFGPSFAPSVSQSPSFSDVQAVVELELFSTVALNISAADLPSDAGDLAAFIDLVERAIEESIDTESNVTLVVDALTLSEQSGGDLTFGFKLITSRDCFVEDCDAFGEQALEELQEDLRFAVVDGSLTEEINTLADESLTDLPDVDIVSFEVTNQTSVALPPSDETSSASRGFIGFAMAIILPLVLV